MNNHGEWWFIGGFCVLGYLLMVIFAAAKVGKAQSFWAWICGALGLACFLVAGFYVRMTWIDDLVGWFVGMHWVLALAAFIVAFLLLGITIAAAIHEKLLPAATLSVGLAAAWLILPSILGHDVIPGEVGDMSKAAVSEISKPLIEATDSWFSDRPVRQEQLK